MFWTSSVWPRPPLPSPARGTERREAGAELETRSDRQFADLVAGFELRQAVLHLDEGKALSGKTAEVVQELRNSGGYRGIPVPLLALEQRAGETVAAGTPDPIQTRPIIDRLFPASVAAQMGAQLITVGSGAIEWPVTTSAVTAGWAATETGNVAGPTEYTTVDKALKPEQSLGNLYGDAARKAGIDARLHGLRKAFCVYWAEQGMTVHQIAAMAGHTSLAEVERYTKAADRKRIVRAIAEGA
ncbi:tyrosine-type recombinase/integrase [Pseudogemmobacter sonorensis]|uniref:tyrosine-type recombinase/integrase n=1 Tax=Pseudogemmobacter sonorensis TaxID=2989681 RepID=UPI0036C3EA76